MIAMKTIIDLPFPISINAMFADGKSRRIKSQRYADWVIEAGWELKRQRVTPVKGQVRIRYELQEGHDNRRRDCFNFEKGVTDLLVEHGVIEADHDLILRGGEVGWNRAVKGVRVTIEPWGEI
jgi:Holliday junction resolvase RusA-like endonuclease